MGFPSRQTGGREHEARAEDSDNNKSVVVYHLAPAIIDIILDENRKCCGNEIEQTLTLLHSEWGKEIEPRRLPRQNLTHHPLIVCNPIDKKGLSSCVETCGEGALDANGCI